MGLRRTVSRIDFGLDAAGFSDHDGRVRVVLLHGGVRSEEKIPSRLST